MVEWLFLFHQHISKIPCSPPYIFQSGWIAKNKRYLNIYLNKLTGEVNGAEVTNTSSGIIEILLEHQPSGIRCIYLRLSHHQQCREYYTGRVYIGVPLITGGFCRMVTVYFWEQTLIVLDGSKRVIDTKQKSRSYKLRIFYSFVNYKLSSILFSTTVALSHGWQLQEWQYYVHFR